MLPARRLRGAGHPGYHAAMTHIPTLATERLRLRPLRAGDLDAYAAMAANPEVMRYLGTGETRTRSEAWTAIAGHLGQWALRGYGQFAIEDAGGAFVGRAGILHPYDWPGPELAYAFDQPYWGKGYATEACRAILRWARAEAGLGELVSFIYPAPRGRSSAPSRNANQAVSACGIAAEGGSCTS